MNTCSTCTCRCYLHIHVHVCTCTVCTYRYMYMRLAAEHVIPSNGRGEGGGSAGLDSAHGLTRGTHQSTATHPQRKNTSSVGEGEELATLPSPPLCVRCFLFSSPAYPLPPSLPPPSLTWLEEGRELPVILLQFPYLHTEQELLWTD